MYGCKTGAQGKKEACRFHNEQNTFYLGVSLRVLAAVRL